ncbi:hypothetical protein [Thioalkalivibrio sp. ALE23]|uniref:hypothetical protein n=1 Tax=Thioalkalivibrio sp. ALE23 TaxID=1265495 RepID=UPI0003738DF1|nr:hypothetical protein [Thioalkalivibrio sp. ALE23]
MTRLNSVRSHTAWRARLALLLLLALAWLVYRPGLSGDFIFDDLTNLALLGFYGTIDNLQAFWLYVLSGFAGPTGRPVAMASFLIDARNWPADPEPFKHTNVLIHLAIGVVLFGLLHRLARALEADARTAALVALLATALWLLHPLWVSTTLYVVQRMAQLATLFVLAGLWLYVRTRLAHPPEVRPATVLGMAGGIGGCGLLAVLSKENGALLPLLALVLEGTILAAHARRHGLQPTRGFVWWRRIVLGVPVALLLAYLATRAGALLSDDPGTRGFTALERLLTQGRILWDYVGHLALPRPVTGGVFQDHITVSTGLFSPWTTALAWAAWITLAALAIVWRLRFPALAAAILFFLAAHLLESSFIQLELYFEHRNHLAAALLGLPLALAWLRWKRPDALTRTLVPLLVIAALALVTALRADLWGSPFQQARGWAEAREDSARAQHYLAGFWRETGHYEEEERLIRRAIELNPEGIPWRIRAVGIACERGRDPHEPLEGTLDALASMSAVRSVQRSQVNTLLEHLHGGGCPGLDQPEDVLAIIDRLEADDRARNRPGLGSTLELWRGHVHLDQGEIEPAVAAYRRSLGEEPRPGRVLAVTARIASAGHLEDALVFLETTPLDTRARGTHIDGIRARYTERTGYYEREREHLRGAILEDLLAPDYPIPAPRTGQANME